MARRREDSGAALVMVILLGFVSIILVATGLTVATSGLNQAVTSQRSTSAMDAAFAGVQDYLARVNTDDTYVTHGNKTAKFTIDSGSVATVTTDATNPAFAVDTGSSSTWASVPGSATSAGGTPTAWFRYAVDNSTYKTTGTIRLQVTGKSGERTRTLLAQLRVRGFVDYSYFTDYEIQDPQISGAPSSCVKHVWEGRGVDCGGVKDIQFGSSDALSGDVHSNDQMVICGATFTGNITTAQTGTLYSTRNCSTTKTITNISHADALPMPSTNTSMRQDAGCLYTGPTQITYNSDGTMTVVSPWTRYTRVTGTTGSNPSACGTPSQLGTPTGATVAQLDQDLVYVQNVPSLSSDPNYWNTSSKPSNVTCVDSTGANTSASDGIGWGLSGSGPSIRYPLSNEAPVTTKFGVIDSSWNTTTPAYGCRNGDAFIKGTITTQTTAGSENYVYVIGDILYSDQSQDILGLVGQNAVFVWNPMSSGTDQPLLSGSNREIDAAIISVAHTFQVQNYDRGPSGRGALKVFGSIGQKFRGPVAASNPTTGYTKSYAYDGLLKTVSPPKFLAPASTSFTVTRYASIPAGYLANGVAQ